MKISFAILALLASGLIAWAQAPSWTTKNYHILVDGNRLYSFCQSAEKDVRRTGETLEFRTNAGPDLFLAGQCWGYVAAIVDSIPMGEGFDPDPKVPLSEEVDVVIAYLRNHPERRHLPAYYLTRTALAEAFPMR